MKKVLLMGMALVFAIASQAQGDVRKQTGGEHNLEFFFSPLGSSPVSINGIRFRKFDSATSAWRGTVFLGFQSMTDKSLSKDEDETELKDTESSWDVDITIGKEKHFAGTDVISPYVGAELLVGYGQENTKMEMKPADDVLEVTTSMGVFRVGANAVAGCDVYVTNNFYFGGELGFGLLFTSEGKTKTEAPDGDGGTTTVETPGGSEFGIGPNVIGAIRAGFLFNKGSN